MTSTPPTSASPVFPRRQAHPRRSRRSPLWPLGLAALSVTCHASADPPSRPASALEAGSESVASPLSAPLGPLDVERARPLAAERAALLALEAGDEARALTELDSVEREEAAWLRARAYEALDRDDEHVAALTEVMAHDGALAPWARLELAMLTPARAEELLAPLSDLAWAGDGEARLAIALSQAEGGDLTALTAYVADQPTSNRAERALADRLAASDDDAARELALGHYRALDGRAPSSELERLIDATLSSLPRERREALESQPLALALARAETIAAMHRHAEGEAAFAAVARAARGEALHAIWCQAELGVGRAHYRERERREAIEVLDVVAERCTDVPDAGAWARYFSGKSFANLDERAESVARWDALATEYPEHRLADDARVEAARLLIRMGDADGARERLGAVTAMTTPADMRGEARFVRTWMERAAGNLEVALAEIEASLAEGPDEDAEDERGRAAYWRAMLLSELGRPTEALDAFVSLANADPLSYYGQQARARVVAEDPGRLAALTGGATLAFTPELSPSPALDRALALLRVGESARAVRELEALGVLRDDASAETLWWVAALFDRAGAHHRAVELTRRRLQSSLATGTEDPRFAALVDIAYPRAYAELIDGAAGTEGIPSSLVFAIAREESSFEPRAVSIAHAYGMLQIIRPTARGIAERLGLPSDVRSLARPDVSVRIGARYLRDLTRRYESNPSVVPAAYNAGQGAVDRWLRLHGSLDLDAWIEEIPFGETRRYTRRVLMSQGIYEWRIRGSFPARPRRLPH